jgi:hypothetical protein
MHVMKNLGSQQNDLALLFAARLGSNNMHKNITSLLPMADRLCCVVVRVPDC